jgi:hypothetical protein
VILQEFIDTLRRKIGDEYSEQSRDLINGTPGDFSEYRYAIGRLNGLNTVHEMLNDLVKEANTPQRREES